MDHFLLVTISLFFLLTIASYTQFLARKIKFPHTVVLFIIGVLIAGLGQFIPAFKFVASFQFSKDLVFFVFLPTLIFESAYNIPYKKLLRDAIPIGALSIVSLAVSAIFIGIFLKFGLGLVGLNIPFSITFLFGAIISATDPVAVLSIFKEFGVPKRISYLFEGESIFNDGTALALFLIILEIVRSGSALSLHDINLGIVTFLSMIIGGFIIGGVFGVMFSKSLEYTKDSWAELTITLILAHTTFITAEVISHHAEIFKVSGIIATAVAGIVMGSYGRYKISKRVREMMDDIWGYLAFIANSLIFLLMGLMIGSIKFDFKPFVIPILFTIFIVLITRLISVYGVLTPLNYFLKEKIPTTWKKLLAWGSLRGAIAITMLLFIPENMMVPGWDLAFTPKEFISVIVISCVVFTLIFKVVLMQSMIKKLKLTDLTKQEEFNLHQLKEIIDKSILNRLQYFQDNKHITKDVVTKLRQRYSNDLQKENRELEKCNLKEDEFKNLLIKYALGVERRSIIKVFETKQIDEITLKQVLNSIENQFMRIETGNAQLKSQREKEMFTYRFKEWFKIMMLAKKDDIEIFRRKYLFFRARAIVSEKVIFQLERFQKDFYSNNVYNKCFSEVINQYKMWQKKATRNKLEIIAKLRDNPNIDINLERANLLNSHLLYIEEKLINRLYSKHIMSGKVKSALEKRIWEA